MNEVLKIQTAVKIINILELIGIWLTLLMALGFQIFLHDLPCPLCMLQRIGFFGVAIGLLMNLRLGLHPSHYSIVLLSALFTSFVALRQISLHVIPGTGSYGEPFLGLHLYTWSFIISMIIIIVTTLVLGIDRQYENNYAIRMRTHWMTHLLFSITAILIMVNIILLFLLCGLSECPENPSGYKLFTMLN